MILLKSPLGTPRLSTRPSSAHWLQKFAAIPSNTQWPPGRVTMGDSDISILIVEDDEDTRDGLMILLGTNHDCTPAGSAEEAVRLLAARKFNLLITDIHMPGASGLELCSLVHRTCPDTVVIVLS